MANAALPAIRRLSIAIAIAVVFIFGLATTVYLSLRSPEVTVPDLLGKNRFEAEEVLSNAGLNFRVRAVRPSAELTANTVLFQVPRAGEVVKAGQTVAMDISRSVKEGETSEAVAPEKKPEEKSENKNTNESANSNENKARRKTTNKNDNANANSANRNANNNRRAKNTNANSNANRPANGNSNRPSLIINNNSLGKPSQNANSRPPAPRPTPASQPTRENR